MCIDGNSRKCVIVLGDSGDNGFGLAPFTDAFLLFPIRQRWSESHFHCWPFFDDTSEQLYAFGAMRRPTLCILAVFLAQKEAY